MSEMLPFAAKIKQDS